jgi:hypothetical protein
MAKEVIETDIEVMEPEEKEFSLSGGKFFEDNPDKVLAEPYEASGRFGPVTKYRPKKGGKAADAIKAIKTPEFIGHGITDLSAGASVIISPEETPVGEQIDNVDKAIEQTEKSIIKRQRSEKRVLQEFEEPAVKPTVPFEDSVRNQNLELTDDEIKAFLWYMHQKGITYRGKWLNIFNPTVLSTEQESAFVNNWVKGGVLFYFSGQLLPASIYFSENLYERKAQFEKDQDDIIKIYGKEALSRQETKLNEAYGEIYNNRLKLDNPEAEQRLHLKPYGDFTASVFIKSWNLDRETGDPEKFLVATDSKGDINWYSTRLSLSSWKDTKKDELSIADAFRFWLKWDNNKPDIPNNFRAEDIFRYYIDKKSIRDIEDKTVVARNRAVCKDIGDRFFSRFLADIILENDRVKIETIWNEKYNGSKGLVTDKIPIGFECALNYPGDEPFEVRAEKREGVAFAAYTGSSLNAYQVGVGKTITAVLTIEQFLQAVHCSRPVIIVPNQVYKQFYAEMKGVLPHRKLNDLYNLSKDYYEKLLDENGNIQMVEEGSITMLTYEGFEQIGFNEDTANNLLSQLMDAVTQLSEMSAQTKKGEKDIVRTVEKLKGMLGKALQKTKTNIEDLGFDFLCFDEAHALKNIFSQVKAKHTKVEGGEKEDEKEKREKKMYEIQGSSSTRGLKAYMLCSYIQLKNQGRNVLLLTATPFTNSPLEVYSMLSLVAYQYLRKIGLGNVNDFFDNYAQMSYELVINSKLQPIRKQIFKAFDNLQSLQKLVYKFMLHKEAGKADQNGNIIALVRPDKWVLPYKGRHNDKNEFIPAGEDEMIDTVLPLTGEQKEFMEEIVQYVEGKISYKALQARGLARFEAASEVSDEEIESGITAEEVVLDEDEMDEKEKAGVRTLRGVNFARSVALSPYLYQFSGLGEPDYRSFVEKSPKLKHITGCIKSVKLWHEGKGEPVSSQVIYMDRGKKYFELIKDYLIQEIGYKAHEIGIIRSGKEGTAKHKDFVKNTFNGLKFNEDTKSFSDIPDEERIKVVIGTSSIREGINLQRYGTVLYNANIDWNPTDEIQLEGRMWRQGNTFKNIRIVISLMADSMDIFMLQKLEEKTERINSIWNYDGKSNVLKVEELDPREQKLALVTDPSVIAKLEVEDEETRIGEDISVIDSNINTAKNILGFYTERDSLDKELSQVLAILEPDKVYSSIDQKIRDMDGMLKEAGEKEKSRERFRLAIRASKKDTGDYEFIDYNSYLKRPWSYGAMKAAVASLKKARRSFFDKFQVSENAEAIEIWISGQEKSREKLEEEKKRLKSEDFIKERVKEIEHERKLKKINVASVEDRIKEFEKLNYLLGVKRDKELVDAEAFIYTEIEGCPPMKGESRDISPAGIKKLEACLERIPQTKYLHVTETGEYTEARQKVHRNIRAKLLSGLSCRTEREKPVAILTGGPPAGGKTTFLKKYAPNMGKEKIYKVDADEIRTMLPEYKGWNASATHKETQDIYRDLLQDISQGKPCRFDLLWDGTMNKAENYLPLIGDLRKLGYDIYLIFVTVEWKESRAGVIERYGRTGRYVPMEVVDEANKAGVKAFETLKEKADGWMLVQGGREQKLVEKGGRDILADRGYFDKEPTEKDVKLKKARAIAIAQAQAIEILKLKAA